NDRSVREIQRTDFGFDLQVDLAIAQNAGGETQTDAKFFELNRNLLETARSGHEGVWEFAAGQELRLRAVQRQEVRLSQNLQQIPVLERFNCHAQIDIAPEEKNVEQVAQVEDRPGASYAGQARRSELLSGNCADGVCSAGRK